MPPGVGILRYFFCRGTLGWTHVETIPMNWCDRAGVCDPPRWGCSCDLAWTPCQWAAVNTAVLQDVPLPISTWVKFLSSRSFLTKANKLHICVLQLTFITKFLPVVTENKTCTAGGSPVLLALAWLAPRRTPEQGRSLPLNSCAFLAGNQGNFSKELIGHCPITKAEWLKRR